MRFKIRNALIGVIAYVYILATLAAFEIALAVAFAVYATACMLIARAFISGAERRKSANAVEFARVGAADSFGFHFQFGSFHHVFYSKEAVIEAFHTALNNALTQKLNCADMREVVFKDVDRELRTPESRTFLVTTASETVRKNGFALLCNFTRSGSVQGVRWWMLVSGARDPNKVLWRYVLAPLSIPFVILPYIRRQYDPLSGLMTIYPGFFNDIDILNRTREIQFVAFESLVEVLDSFEIDTSDLKQQKGNILNINVSGGQTSFGSVVQGAMNKVIGRTGGKKS